MFRRSSGKRATKAFSRWKGYLGIADFRDLRKLARDIRAIGGAGTELLATHLEAHADYLEAMDGKGGIK